MKTLMTLFFLFLLTVNLTGQSRELTPAEIEHLRSLPSENAKSEYRIYKIIADCTDYTMEEIKTNRRLTFAKIDSVRFNKIIKNTEKELGIKIPAYEYPEIKRSHFQRFTGIIRRYENFSRGKINKLAFTYDGIGIAEAMINDTIKRGGYTIDGVMRIPPKYKDIQGVLATGHTISHFYTTGFDDKKGLYKFNGELIFHPVYDDIIAHYEFSNFIVKIGEKYTVVDSTGKQLMNPTHHRLKSFIYPEGTGIYYEESNKSGIIDLSGKELLNSETGKIFYPPSSEFYPKIILYHYDSLLTFYDLDLNIVQQMDTTHIVAPENFGTPEKDLFGKYNPYHLFGEFVNITNGAGSAVLGPDVSFEIPFGKYKLGTYNKEVEIVPFRPLEMNKWGMLRKDGTVFLAPEYGRVSGFYKTPYGQIRAAISSKGKQFYVFPDGSTEPKYY